MKKLLNLCILIIFLHTNVNSQSIKGFSKEEIIYDLEYLKNSLEVSTYNLYAYTNKEVFDSEYKKIYNSINDSLTSLQVYRLFQPYVALAKMGHCQMEFPWEEYYGNYLRQGGTIFPLNLSISNSRVYVKNNCSNDSLIDVGDEILSINEKLIKDILTEMYSFVSGENEYHINSVIESLSFPKIYWSIYGKCDVFSLKIRKKDGEITFTKFPAISGFEFDAKNPNLLNVYHRELRFVEAIAYMRPGAFFNANGNNDMMNQEMLDKTEFCHYIDSSFYEIHRKSVKNLIIDLRDNWGGDNSFSDYMIAYFASKPFYFCSKFKVKTSQITKDFWKNVNDSSLQEMKQKILSHNNGDIFDITFAKNQPRTDSLRYTGNVYVLINRYSYSNATSTAAIIKDYGFGILIGEETPDLPSAYGATHLFKLPNTQMSVQYPKGFSIRPNGDISPKGVIPDYQVNENALNDKDEILDFTIKLIKNK